MRTSPILLLLALAACHSANTPAERVEQSAREQQRVEAYPPDGNPHAAVVSVDHDAATPTNAGANQP